MTNKSNLSPEQIRILIDQFALTAEQMQPVEAERQIIEILIPLIAKEGYSILYSENKDDSVDYIAQKKDPKNEPFLTTGIEYKHYRKGQFVSAASVRKLISISASNNLDRIIFLTNTKFSGEAWDIVNRESPVAIELLDIDALRLWVSRLERSLKQDHSKVVKAITELSKALAREIANRPAELDFVEWRDLERMLASVFEGLGFVVELTPSSKDGGKDIVLESVVSGNNQIYIVEIKHWRSRKHVGKNFISDFVKVIAKEKRHGGLYLATYGYCDDAFEALTEVDKELVRFGKEEKIVSLCQTFVKAEAGIWKPSGALPQILFDNTVKAV